MSNNQDANRKHVAYQDFEKELHLATKGKGSLWLLRDMAYAEILSNNNRRPVTWIIKLPFGWFPLLLYSIIIGLFKRRFNDSEILSRSHHFLIPNAAVNHYDRMASVFSKNEFRGCRKIWIYDPRTLNKMSIDEKSDSSLITDEWIKWFRLNHVKQAMNSVRPLKKTFFGKCNPTLYNKTILAFIKYFSLKNFWDKQLINSVSLSAFSTYEKSYLTKSFFKAAAECEVPNRIHWLHGLAHVSHCPTFATEIWCSSSAECEMLRNILPGSCIPVHVSSPRVKNLINEIGIISHNDRQKIKAVKILVLGTGNDPNFTEDMRKNDLHRLQSIQELLGSSAIWRFRAHPSARKRYKTAIIDAGLIMESFSDNTLEVDLKWCDIVFAPYSSVAVEAHEIGRLVFWTLPINEDLYGVSDLVNLGIGQRINPSNAFEIIHQKFPLLGT
jgi:hypothetical protein